MGIVLFLYICLLIGFLFSVALIYYHTSKFGYLSPRFKTIMTVFGLTALVIIIFSLFMVIGLFKDNSPSPYSYPSTPSSSGINF